ncbi:MAG: 5'/3'-nucleotidase SurE [Candidatus Obscuribacterales bacterium]
MRILISNDDGVFAPGLGTLARALAATAEHEVYVVAPDRQRSATGHSVTLHKPLRVEAVDLEGGIKAAWSTTGTPSDCVKLAVKQLLPQPPDLIISGINSGPNLGSDVLYSGTVAAAMEGAFSGFPSIAVSAQKNAQVAFNLAAEFIVDFLRVLPKAPMPNRGLFNVNVPACEASQLKGVRVTELGKRQYKDIFERRHDPNGRDYYWLSGCAIEEGESELSDVWALANGYITISPVSFNMTDQNTLAKLHEMMTVNEFSHHVRSSK